MKLIVRDLHLLTLKPVLYAANLSEDGVAEADSNPYVQQVRDFAVRGERDRGSDQREG